MCEIKEKEIEKVYSNWKKALIGNDVKFLDSLYSNDFTSISPAGISKNKSEALTRLGFKDIKYLMWSETNVAINIEGENAIVKSLQTLDIELYGLLLQINREIILTFETHNGKWLLKNLKENSD